MEWFIIGGLSAIGGIIGAWFYGAARDWTLYRRLINVEKGLLSLQNSERGKISQQKSAELNEQMQTAMVEAVQQIQGGAQIQDVIKNLALKYPALAMKLAKQGGLKL